jgi:hypothetical protein
VVGREIFHQFRGEIEFLVHEDPLHGTNT